MKVLLSRKYFRALTIAATGFGGGMLGLWALKLSASIFGTSALNDSAVRVGLTVAVFNTRDVHAGVNQLLDLLGGGRRGA
mgnify:CR=1 FL=1